MMDIKVVSLVTGEDVLADIESGHESFKLKRPVVLGITQDRAGNQQLAFQPWKPFTKSHEKGINVFSEHILAISEAEDNIHNAYNEKFGTGLKVPQQGVQTPEPSQEGEGTLKIDDFRNNES